MEIEEIEVSKLSEWLDNPREISEKSLKRLIMSIERNPEFLNKRPLLVTTRDNKLIVYAGNQRLKAIKKLGWNKIPVIIDNEINDEKMKEQAMIDNIQWGELLLEKLPELKLDEEFLKSLNINLNDDRYTQKILTPVYEVMGEDVSINDLFDTSKTDNLIKEINNSNIPNESKEFLKKAATRHIIFNYSKIAEFYAKSDKETQELMESSALVIIDYNKAIESGFVELTEYLKESRYEE